MSGHASRLDLDELAAGLGAPELRAHAAACGSCRDALARVEEERAAVLRSPGFARVRRALPQRSPRRFLWLVPAAAACAALAIFAVSPSGGLRAKGSASLALSPPQPRVGEEAELRLSSGAHRYAIAFAEGTVLWPPGGARSGELAGGRAAVPVRVTPGAVEVVAVYSDEPLSLAEAAAEGPGRERIALQLRPQP